jgi:hypothetical protein
MHTINLYKSNAKRLWGRMMRILLIAIACALAGLMGMNSACGYQSVGEDFGQTWLEQYGTQPASTVETHNNLWNWGQAPKGYSVLNGTLYPPGYLPQWYYPSIYSTDYNPIVLNDSVAGNYLTPSQSTSTLSYVDPWLLAQLTGRPVQISKATKGSLF